MESRVHWLFLVFSLCFVSGVLGLTPTSFLTSADRTRLADTLNQIKPYSNVLSTYYTLNAYTLLGLPIRDTEGACALLKSVAVNSTENAFYLSGIGKLGKCQAKPETKTVLNDALKEGATAQDIYYALFGLKNLGQAVDSAKVLKLLQAALKKDDSIASFAHGFHVASQLTVDVSSIFDRIEDAVVQADEVDGKYAQFEGGITVTAQAVSGIYRLADKAGKVPAIDHVKCVKFANYLLSRKNVGVPRAIFTLLDALTVLSNNKHHIPVAITFASRIDNSAENPNVQVRVTNILGASLGQLSVLLDSANRIADNTVLASGKALAPVAGDDSLYQVNIWDLKPLRGFYNLKFSANPKKADARLIGNTGAELETKVCTTVKIDSANIGLEDLDQATPPKLITAPFGSQVPTPLEADFHQKLIATFTIKDTNTGKPMTLHQVFVKFTNEQTKQEIIFIAEADATDTYKFDVDLRAKAKDFGYLSGTYAVDIIYGDAVVLNPYIWRIARVNIAFPDHADKASETSVTDQYLAKPEIKHIFRPLEKRPAPTVSTFFTILTIAPLFILFVHWILLGANISNFSFSPATIGFHAGLLSIFVLLYYFWVNLNMFTTLKCLAGCALITFLAGNAMLSRLANERKGKK